MAIVSLTKIVLDALLGKNDPVKHCEVYKEIGCTHVDGFLCDMKTCEILKDHRDKTTEREEWHD